MQAGSASLICASKDPENGDSIQVEVGLIDPFRHVKAATLYYLAADKIPQKLQPADRLKALSGCHRLQLKIEDQVAVGKIPLKSGVGAVSICCQAGYTSASGPESYTARVEEKIVPEGKAKDTEVAQPSTSGPRPIPTPLPTRSPSEWVGPKTADDLAKIVADFDSGDRTRRFAAMKKLERSRPPDPDPAVAKALTAVLLEDGDSTMRSTAGSMLVNWGRKESLPALKRALKDPEFFVRNNVQKAIDAIELRYQADSPASPTPSPETTPHSSVAKDVPSHRPPRHGRIDELPSAEEVESLLADLKSGDLGRLIRSTARLMRTKPNEPNPAVAKALAGVLADGDNVVMRINAAHALENWGTPECIPALKKAAQSDNPSLQRHAKNAIGEIMARQ